MKQTGQIHFHDIGDYLSQAQKLEIIQELGSIKGISDANGWSDIEPDEFGDWVNQRDPNFESYISIGDKKDKAKSSVFDNYSRGVMTSKDFWLFNASQTKLSDNCKNFVNFYECQREEFKQLCEESSREAFLKFCSTDSTKISWDGEMQLRCAQNKSIQFADSDIVRAMYRPFQKSWYYFNKNLNLRLYQAPQIFPKGTAKNIAICLSLSGSKSFSLLVSNVIPDLHLIGDDPCCQFRTVKLGRF